MVKLILALLFIGVLVMVILSPFFMCINTILTKIGGMSDEEKEWEKELRNEKKKENGTI